MGLVLHTEPSVTADSTYEAAGGIGSGDSRQYSRTVDTIMKLNLSALIMMSLVLAWSTIVSHADQALPPPVPEVVEPCLMILQGAGFPSAIVRRFQQRAIGRGNLLVVRFKVSVLGPDDGGPCQHKRHHNKCGEVQFHDCVYRARILPRITTTDAAGSSYVLSAVTLGSV